MRRAHAAALLFACVLANQRSQHEKHNTEEEAVLRMLTLDQRDLVSNKPLPLTELEWPSGSCTASGDGRAAAMSPWEAGFAAAESAGVAPHSTRALKVEQQFLLAARAVRDGHFSSAQQQLYAACVAGSDLLAVAQNQTGGQVPSSDAPAPAEVLLLGRWVTDCTTLLQYVPAVAPQREDHKRLLMLLHDLGGSLLLYGLLGVLPEPLVRPEALGEVALAIRDFGEVNRKTALSMALQLAVSDGAKQQEAYELLRRHALCGDGDGNGSAGDGWGEVGVRLCATLLLRTGRPEGALGVLKEYVSEAHELHRFISAFELSGRCAH